MTISLFTVILLPFLRHRIPLCCFPPHKFRVFCVAGMVLSMDLECSPRSSEALSAESRSPCGEQLVTGGVGADQQALKRGGGGTTLVPIQFLAVSICGIGLSLSDEGIRLRQSFWPKFTCVLASDRTGFLHVSKVPGQQAARSSRGVKRKSRKKFSGEVCSCRFKENRCSPPGRRSTAS